MKLYSINVRGLRDNQKRREIFNFLKRKQYDIILIQESRSTKDVEQKWEREWGNKCLYSHKTSQSRGVMIMLSSNIEIVSNWNDTEGRVILTEIKVDDDTFGLANVYAPYDDLTRTGFLKSLISDISMKITSSKLILGGDWNLALGKNR